MKIGNVELKNPYILAPMAGFTEVAFRSIAAKAGAGLTVTEMISARGLVYGSEHTHDLLLCEDNESPKSVQLFGNDPAIMADAVQCPEVKGFDIIDINMGCPVPKVVRQQMGSALMRDLNTAARIIEAAVLKAGRPVTVKMRLGFDKNEVNAVEFAKMIQDAGACAICVHGRTRDQMYAGAANWELIEQVAASVGIPVIGNGDIATKDEACKKLTESGCSGVAIGRGALGNPWIFCELGGGSLGGPVEVIEEHFEILLKYFPMEIVLPFMRKHLSFYVRNQRNAKYFRDKINRSNDYGEVMELVKESFLQKNEKIVE